MNSTLDALWLSQFVRADGTLDLAALEAAEQEQSPPDSECDLCGGSGEVRWHGGDATWVTCPQCRPEF